MVGGRGGVGGVMDSTRYVSPCLAVVAARAIDCVFPGIPQPL